MIVKDEIIKMVNAQPDDSSYEEILIELVFNNMILRGLKDSDNNKTVSHQDMGKEIDKWCR